MIENYKFDKLAGSSITLAGYIIFFFGLITVYFTLTAIPVILLGAVLAFSYRGTRLKFGDKRYQSYLAIFGFIRIGFWLPFEKSDKIFVKEFKVTKVLSILRNCKNKIEKQDFRVLIMTSYNEKEVPLARFNNEQNTQKIAKELQTMINSL